MKEIIASVPLWLTAPLMLAFCLGCIRWTCLVLIKHHAGFVRTVWYFFFLFACLTIAVGALCSQLGAIDAKGSFVGAVGYAVNNVLKVIFALNEDMMTAGGLVALVLLPQGLSYLFGGCLSGVAVAPRYIGPVVRFALLSLAKSFVIAGGVFLGLGLVAWMLGWTRMDGHRMVEMLVLSFALLMSAFYTLTGYALTDSKFTSDDNRVPSGLQAIHAFMTRNNPKGGDATRSG